MAEEEVAAAEEAAEEVVEESAEEESGEAKSLIAGGEDKLVVAEEGEESAAADPVNYAELELPEGLQLDTQLLEEYAPVLQEANVSAEQAQKLFPIVQKIREQDAQKQMEAYEAARTQDRAILAKLSREDMAAAKTAAEKYFGSDNAKAALEGRAGDTPWLIEGLVAIGKEMADDKFVEGGSGGGAKKPPEKVLYPTMAEK